jgi:hypothetical protein
MFMGPRNRSVDGISGLDDPHVDWLQRTVRVKGHPEWGEARVLRWYPRVGETPERLRVMPVGAAARPQLVSVADVELVTG